MKKALVLLPVILILSGCFDFLPFYKYDYDPEPVDVRWEITSAGGTQFSLKETHPGGTFTALTSYSNPDVSFVLSSQNDGFAPAFGNLITFKDHSPFDAMWGYLDYFLDHVKIGVYDSGDYDSFSIPNYSDGEYFHVYYYSQDPVTIYPISDSIIIDSVLCDLQIDGDQFGIGTTLAVVTFNIDSNDGFLGGWDGIAIFASGSVDGLIYFSFRHRSGFRTIIKMENFIDTAETDAGDYFWGAMTADYKWFYFQDSYY